MVVPVSIMIDCPSAMVVAASRAMASLAERLSPILFSKGASLTSEGKATAPCMRMTAPQAAKGFTSLRTVSKETSSLRASSLMLMVPSASRRARIWLWRGE